MIILYVFLVLVFLIFVITKDKNVFLSFIVLYMCFVFYIRMAEPQSDFVYYHLFLEYDWRQYFTNTYFLREFMFWLPAKLLYEIIGDQRLVYLTYDVLLILFLSFSYNKDKRGIFIFYLLIFPSILGVGNIYRQHIIASILVYIMLCKPKTITSILLITMSLFIHNMTLLFIPLLLVRYDYFKLGMISLVSMVIGFVFVENYKSVVQSGTYMTVLYIAVLFSLLIFLYFHKYMVKEASVILVIAISSYLLLPINQAERIAMVSFCVILTLSILKLCSRYKNTEIFVSLLALIPTLLFPNSLSVLSSKLSGIQ